MNDLKFAIRQLIKRPGSTVVMLVTLAVVIGAMSLAFGVIQFEHSRWLPRDFESPSQNNRWIRIVGRR